MAEELEQEGFAFEPQREIVNGVEFEFNGKLFLPAVGGDLQLKADQKDEAEQKERRTKVKMKFKDFVRLRSK